LTVTRSLLAIAGVLSGLLLATPASASEGAEAASGDSAGPKAGASEAAAGDGADTGSADDPAEASGDDGSDPDGERTDHDAGAEPALAPPKAELFDHVIDEARRRAGQAYSKPAIDLPGELADMSYSQFRQIQFRGDAALWGEHSSFRVEFFHPGFLYETPVTIHEVTSEGARKVTFDHGAFQYRDGADGMDAIRDAAAGVDDTTGYAGFRIRYPLNAADAADEMMVFLGASYFRLVGPDQAYGLSARGLAIDTAEPRGEEFPAFREFWLVRPSAEATTLRIYALLDSPSVTGAYRFDVKPGSEVRVDVASRVFARQDVGKLGVAPLTSMFLFGENSVGGSDDFRPEVHDSDGLLLHRDGGRWLWRPLTNPNSLRVTSHSGEAPMGFGLAQRDRDFEHYLDEQAHYDRRPSLWVEPTGGDWNEGRVELVEIPLDSETNDNISAYWVPSNALAAGDERRYDYSVSTFGAHRPGNTLGRVVRTRNGWGPVSGPPAPPPKSKRQFIVAFEGPRLARLSDELPVEPVMDISGGEVEELTARRLPTTGRWRVSFKLSPGGNKPADMRLHLALRGERLTETWNYVWANDDR